MLRPIMRSARKAALLLGLPVVLGVALASTGCSNIIPPSATPIPPAAAKLTTAPPPTSLGNVEVDNYKGKRLDAVAKEPENSIKGPQHIDIKSYRLTVNGMVAKPLSLRYDQVLALPAYQKVTTLNCVEGWSVTYLWQGILLKDLLQQAGYDPNGKVVIFHCYDGYSTSLPLDFIINRDIMMAYRMNGIVMPPERGFPFQVVAQDQLGYKWAKWVTGIEVSDDANYRGYWESRGYENSATVPGTAP